MGFLNVGRRFIGNIHDIIDDRIDTLCRGTMGLTVACARCHDHKVRPCVAAGLLRALRRIQLELRAGGVAQDRRDR
jgi:hypothetical protein